MAVLSVPFILQSATANGQSRSPSDWVISALHPDPTPSLGAPDAEYIALYARPSGPAGPGTLSTEGLVLSWNGHDRELPPGEWAAGSTVVVHRAADSLHFTGWAQDRIGLPTWPALVNGGTLVLLSDSVGTPLDAVLYDEKALAGGGRPLLRKDATACGSMANFQRWVAPEDPFEPLHESADVHHVAWTSGALKSGAEQFDRLIIRGPGRLEWRLPGPVDPRSMLEAEWRIGGELVPPPEWSSDSVVMATWTDRLGMAPDSPSGQGMPVRLGPVRGCAAGSPPVDLMERWTAVPSSGDVRVVGMLADPLPDAPFQRSEFIQLFNAADRSVDAGSWRWGEARLTRRRLMAPGETQRFEAEEFEGWPGLSNAGGTMHITAPSGHPVAALSWSPCAHSVAALDGRGLPVERGPARGSDWHTEGHRPGDPNPHVVGYGCPRDWSGRVSGIEVHWSVPVVFLGETEWTWVTPFGGGVPMAVEVISDAPNSMWLVRQDGEDMDVDWPSRATLRGRSISGEEEPMHTRWTVEVTCPPASLPEQVELRVGEALWAAEDGGGEFVELENRSGFPLDLRGLQATESSDPNPSDWDVWVGEGRSLILETGHVMAFGRCARWFRRSHDQAGPACWPVEEWSALPDDEGHLAIRLPSHGPETLDSVSWHAGLRGPWWWREKGWSWHRMGPDAQAWTPSADGGSPGREDGMEPMECSGPDVPVSVFTGQHGAPALQWRFPSAGHGALLRMIRWPDGTLVNSQSLIMEEQQGEWTWGGTDSQGIPVPPGVLIWDVRWWGRTCRGRFRERVRVPGQR